MNDGMAAPASVLREVPRTAAPTLLSAAPRRPIVMVLGMHRSGTSLCAHVLSALGLDMTDNMAAPGWEAPRPENPKGHWERWEIVEFHDRILNLLNRSLWPRGADGLPSVSLAHDFSLPVAWWADPRVAELRREITVFLQQRMGAGYFGFKDPRTVRLMPMWHQIMSELKLAPRIVYCLRNPAQVARSLHVRDGFNIEMGEYRWLTYNIDFFRYTKASEFCTIEYESWFEEPHANLAKLRGFLNIPDEPEFDLDPAIAGIIDDELRHDDPLLGEARQPLIRSVYKLARQAEHDGAAREQLGGVAAQFQTFQQLQAGLRREFEQAAAAAAKLPVLEQEAAVLRAALGERDAQIGTVRVEAEANAARVAVAAAEIEQQRGELSDLVRERDEMARALETARAAFDTADATAAKLPMLEQEAAALRAALGERDAQIGTVRVEAEANAARVAVAAAEIEQQRGELSDLVRERDEMARALETARAAFEAADAARAHSEGRLSELEEALGSRAAAAEAMGAELTGLREALVAR
jgi:hypothetical protein